MTSQLQFPEPVQGVVSAEGAEQAKADGITRATAHTDIDWAIACRQAITVMARRGIPFQAADLIAEGLVDEPDHTARWGAAFNGAARAGLIEEAGFVKSKRATVHGSICKQWTGTETARRAAA